MTEAGALAAARGAVREGAAAVAHFAHLLGSPRAGPRSIRSAVPGVREGCDALLLALVALQAALESELGGPGASVEQARLLVARATAATTAISAGLDDEGTATAARGRLALESTVRGRGATLESALALIDLLASAARSRATPLDLREVLADAGGARELRLLPPVRLRFHLSGPHLVAGDARALAALVACAATVASGEGGAAVALVSLVRADGRLLVELSPTDEVVGRELVLARLELPFVEDAARAAAGLMGVALHVAEGPLVSLVL